MTEPITIHLTPKQYTKIHGNKPIQLSASDLKNSDNKIETEINVSKKLHRNFAKAINHSKGLRLSAGNKDISGGSIKSISAKLKKSIPRSFTRDINDIGSTVKDIKTTVNEVDNIVGGAHVGREILKGLKKLGTTVGKPFEESVGINPFSLGYNFGHDYIAPELIKMRGKGVKVAKGSPEMIAKMAALRDRRKINKTIAEISNVKSKRKAAEKTDKQITKNETSHLVKGGSFAAPKGGSFKSPKGGSFKGGTLLEV